MKCNCRPLYVWGRRGHLHEAADLVRVSLTRATGNALRFL